MGSDEDDGEHGEETGRELQLAWHERRRVWRGASLVVGGAGLLALSRGLREVAFFLALRALQRTFASPSSSSSSPLQLGWIWTLWTAGGAAALAVARRLWHRPCYRDPEALAAYHRELWQDGFMATVARHGFDNVLRQIASSPDDLSMRIAEEMRAMRGFSDVWRAYGRNHLDLLLLHRIVDPHSLHDRFIQEYDRPHDDDDEEEGQQEDEEQRKTVDGLGVLEAMVKYGPWAVEKLDVSPHWVRRRLATDPALMGTPFSAIVAAGGMTLHPVRGSGPKLICRSQLRQAFFEEARKEGWTFKEVKDLCRPWLFAQDPEHEYEGIPYDDNDERGELEDEEDIKGEYVVRSLVRPEELAGMFRLEMKRMDFCELTDAYWEWPLAEYMERLVPEARLADEIRQMRLIYKTACATHNAVRSSVEDQFAKAKQKVDEVFEDKRNAANRVYAAAKEKYEAKLKKIEAKRAALKLEMKSGETDSSKKKSERHTVQLAKVESDEESVRRKLAFAKEAKESATTDASAEHKLIVADLERQRDAQLYVIAQALREEKSRLNQRWLRVRESVQRDTSPSASTISTLDQTAKRSSPGPSDYRPSAPPRHLVEEEEEEHRGRLHS